MPASRRASINLVMGPGETVGQALQDHPGIDGIVFTGSYEVGMRLFHSFSKAWPRPCIVEMGGKNPAIVSRKADLEEAAEGIMRSAFGFGGQKCSANSRVYVERPVHDELVRLLVEKTEKITDRRPARPRELDGPDHRPAGGRPAPGGRLRGAPRRDGLHRRRAPDRRRPGARLLRRADRRRQPADARTACSATSCSRRSPRSPRSTRSTRRSRLANDSVLRADRRRLQRGPGRGPAVPRQRRGRRACTSTGAPARRPARGRASRRSAAGRGAARPARPGCRCTTSRSSCASSPAPSSTEAAGVARDAAARLARVAREHSR